MKDKKLFNNKRKNKNKKKLKIKKKKIKTCKFRKLFNFTNHYFAYDVEQKVQKYFPKNPELFSFFETFPSNLRK